LQTEGPGEAVVQEMSLVPRIPKLPNS